MSNDFDQPRLPWKRSPEGFIAHPEGEDHPARVARLFPQTSRTGAWNWTLRYDGATMGGIEDGRQEASEAANKAWPRVKAMAAEIADREAWKRQQLALIAKAEAGELDPSAFGVEAANYENLMWVMDQVRTRARTPGLSRLIDALSREFFRRRK